MDSVTVIELKKTILEDNDKDAELLRKETKKLRISYLNVMSSPGSGKTTTILALLRAIEGRVSCGVMEADIDSDVDAKIIQEAGYPAVQLHTGGMCHLDAQMSRQGLRAMEEAAKEMGRTMPELVILENVGNLVCPAEFDTGADLNLVLLSVPEGDDKPLKYPLMFEKADMVAVSKVDALPAFDFDPEKCEKNIRFRNGKAPVFLVSGRTGEGIRELADKIVEHVRKRMGGEEETNA